MAATATPTIWDPKLLASGALSTTLGTTLYTAPAEAGVKIMGLVLCAAPGTARVVTIKANGRYLLNAVTLPNDGVGVDVLALIGLTDGLILDPSNTITGGQGTGTDVDYQIGGVEMKD